MRNALNKLADGVTDPAEKKVSILSPPPSSSSAPIAENCGNSEWVTRCLPRALGVADRRGFTSPERMLTYVVLRN
jgi:hypothetical protein